MDGSDHVLFVSSANFARRPLQHLAGGDALILQRRNAARVHRLGNERNGHAHFHGVHHGPFACALLAGSVENLIHQLGAVGFLISEDVAGDLNQVAVKQPLVPIGKDIVNLVIRHVETFVHQLVGLADELHVAVLDAVVHHLHIVASTTLANPVAAGGAALHLGRDRLEYFLHMRPSGWAATGHDARAMAGAFLATGHTCANK